MTARTLMLPVLFAASASCAGVEPQIAERSPAGETVRGVVFNDLDGNGHRDPNEPGVSGVLVSNGREVVATGDDGGYALPVREDMNLSLVQPAGWRLPTDKRNIPQFAYIHKPGGSPEGLRFGGLPDTGPLPDPVDFPLIRRAGDNRDFRCAIIGDSQTYAGDEVGYFRDSVVTDLHTMDLDENDCILYLGDVVGDDLDLLDRLLEIGATGGAPQWLVYGNHDMDFDAQAPADAADTWRRRFGPDYYAFEMGQVMFVVLNNVVYPCGEQDARQPGREHCLDAQPRYNGRIPDQQVQWLANLLEHLPEDRLVVLAHHIPMVSFVDSHSPVHQTDNAAELYALLDGRPALSLAGHTHSIENHAPGQSFAGWAEQVGVEALPFRHIIAGAASGNWWQGDFDINGVPMALQRMGAPRGTLVMDFNGTAYRESYRGARMDPARGQWVDINTPAFRSWFETLEAWRQSSREDRHPVPPLTVHDLPDTRLVTPEELAQGVFLTVNVWAGSAETRVRARIGEGETFELERTQQGSGEAPRIGAAYADPFAAQRQMTVGRYAFTSREGQPRSQGYESFNGATWRGHPQPQGSVADRNMHLWQARLPEKLPTGVHRIEVTSIDRHGGRLTDTLLFEVRETKPARRWRQEPWER